MDKAIIIDDDPLFSKALTHKLEMTYAFDVQSFKNAEKSLNGIKGKPDIIFLDYNLSVNNEVMDGLMALGLFRKHFPESNIIMMSSEDNTHWLKQGQKYGANGYLTKTKDGLFDLEKVVTDFRVKKRKSKS